MKATEGYEAGQQLDWATMFSEGDLVDVQGTSVGKGFQGGIKRHNFKRGLMTHGSKSHREHGTSFLDFKQLSTLSCITSFTPVHMVHSIY